MLERTIAVINPLGLHARAAAKLVRLATQFESAVWLYRQDTGVEADAKSILNVLYIAASCGVELKITVDGTDEIDAMKAVEQLFAAGFGEI
ncbi:MAG: HPr family phosphocarrier protein [Acidobacteria bacterium]|nr:HPr family phosphocarrier protein [Acidobacteriota bacterium]